MTTREHECIDSVARKTIADVRDEAAEADGRLLGEIGAVKHMLATLHEFHGVEAWRRRNGLNGTLAIPPDVPTAPRGKLPSLAEQLVEEVTGSHIVPSVHPVRAFVERKVGRLVLWGLTAVAAISATIAVEHAITAAWAAFTKGH